MVREKATPGQADPANNNIVQEAWKGGGGEGGGEGGKLINPDVTITLQ